MGSNLQVRNIAKGKTSKNRKIKRSNPTVWLLHEGKEAGWRPIGSNMDAVHFEETEPLAKRNMYT